MKHLIIGFLLLSTTVFSQEQSKNWRIFPSKDTNSTAKKEVKTTNISADSIPVLDEVKKGWKNTIISKDLIKEDEKYASQSKAHPQVKGYTILLYSGSGANSRMKAREVSVNFKKRFSNSTTYLAWKSPNFEVRQGDYRTKIEAQRDLKLIQDDFPAAFIKTDMIELPPIERVVLEPIEREN